MKISIAGAPKSVPDGLTVTELIAHENVESPLYVSVSLNDDFVKTGDYATTVVKEGDVVEFLYFMGGGAR